MNKLDIELEELLYLILDDSLSESTEHEELIKTYSPQIKQTILKEALEVLPKKTPPDDSHTLGYNAGLSDCKQKLEELMS